MRFSVVKFWFRSSITIRVLISFLTLFIISMAVIGLLGLNNLREMQEYASSSSISLRDRAVSDSKNALEDQARENLLRLAKDQADISNTLLLKVEAETNTLADFAATIWSDSASFGKRLSYSQEEEPDDIYKASVYALAPDISLSSVREELDLSSNMDDIFIPIYRNDPNLAWIYIGTESGIIRAYPWSSGFDPSFDPRKRGWYINAAETGEIGWTELYIDVLGLGLMVTCYNPVYDQEGELLGVVGADVTLEAMNLRIINTQVGESGYAFLIDNNGRIIARPGLSAGDKKWDESFETESLLDSYNRELTEIVMDMITGNTGVARFEYEGSEKYFAYAPITSTDWSICIVMPVSEVIAPALVTENQIMSASNETSAYFNRQINDLTSTFFSIFFAVLFVVSGLAFLLSKTVTRPVLKVINAAQKLEEGKLSEEEIDSLSQTEGEDEISSLSRIFAAMAAQVRIREFRLKRQVEELQIKVDESKKTKEVTKIIESDYFQRLHEAAKQMREKDKGE